MIDRRDLVEQLSAEGLWELVEDVTDDGDGVMALTEDGERVWNCLINILDNIDYKKNAKNTNNR